MKKIVGILGIAFLGSILGVVTYSLLVKPEVRYVKQDQPTPVQFTSLPSSGLETSDFRMAAQMSVNAVVHVTSTKFLEQGRYRNIWEYFYNEPSSTESIPREGYGSGVIISADGYIVTNNHVIREADEIKIKMNDGTELEAELVGTDPNTDVAVIKVKASDLPYLTFGDSDELQLGDWVMAVGNPLSLQTTVTAGIVSAKARDIGIIGTTYRRDRMGRTIPVRDPNAIESFIQTDAAVNQGNSGGALVNLRGELVGINTAIASQTGAYSGYSFAVPSIIAKRIVSDLIEFGKVKRAALGVTIRTVDAESAEKDNLKVKNGVYIEDLAVDGAANKAGLKKGDVIVAINDKPVGSGSELQEQVLRYHAGEVVDVTVDRKGTTKEFSVKLKEHEQNALNVSASEFWTWLGGELEELSDKDLERMDIESGVKVVKVNGGIFEKIGLPAGFVITDINRTQVENKDDVEKIIRGVEKGGVFIEGVLPNGKYEYYTFRK